MIGIPLLLLLLIDTVTSFSSTNTNIQYRQGLPTDETTISLTLAKELMNPLGIQSDRFIVATDENDNDNIIGWAQIKPLGSSSSSTAQRDPSQFDSRPGSYSLDDEIDDDMWDDFEQDDTIRVPIGFASLPWTKEYRDMQKAVNGRDVKRERLRRRKQAALPQLWELSSVYVKGPYRNEGIGSELVRRVLQRRFGDCKSRPSHAHCLTLAATAAWYTDKFGFEIVERSSDIPSSMALEVAAGSVITKLIGAELCCMRGTDMTLELLSSVSL